MPRTGTRTRTPYRDRAHARTEPLTPAERVRHVLNRFSPGRTPALEAEVARTGIGPWFERQVELGRAGETPESEPLRTGLARLESIDLPLTRLVEVYDEATTEDGGRDYARRRVPVAELRERILLHAVHGLELRAVAADFFRNHFCVSVDKPRVRYYATGFERDVIHHGVFGSFVDLLRASTKHPAMLVYLDNALSRRPPTKAELKKIEMRVRLETDSKREGLIASNLAAQRGLNENFARELLELHTLGVDNGYDQSDVEEVARALTGWTVEQREGEPIGFVFRPEHHAGGHKRLMHHVIEDDWKEPQNEGEEVLAILAAERGTADFLALKLCRHFVHDRPDPDMVERVAKVFRRSKGDLPTVYRAVLEDPAFFERRHFRAKFKRPFELVVSALRATGARIRHTRALVDHLRAMDEDLMACKDPTGYYDQAEAWLDPGAMAVRWRFAMELGTGSLEGIELPEAWFEDLPPERPEDWPDLLGARLLPDGVEPRVRAELGALVERRGRGTRDGERRRRLAGLLTGVLLGSAEFQKQ